MNSLKGNSSLKIVPATGTGDETNPCSAAKIEDDLEVCGDGVSTYCVGESISLTWKREREKLWKHPLVGALHWNSGNLR